jgi:hypothetical protein
MEASFNCASSDGVMVVGLSDDTVDMDGWSDNTVRVPVIKRFQHRMQKDTEYMSKNTSQICAKSPQFHTVQHFGGREMDRHEFVSKIMMYLDG